MQSATCLKWAKILHSKASRCVLIAVTLLSFALMLASAPTDAFGVEVSKCTAKSNVNSTENDILGATETRITLELQADASEEVTGVTFTMPEGTHFSAEKSEIQFITPSDDPAVPGKRIILNDATLKDEGTKLVVDFGQTAPAGSTIRLVVNEVVFPAAGGDMAFQGSCTMADGSTTALSSIPSIPVKGVSFSERMSNTLAQQGWVQSWNSNKFLHLFLDPTVLISSFPIVFHGFFMALAIVFVSFPLAIPFGLLLALMRMSRLRIFRGIASAYVNIVRGTPVFLQIYIAFFGLPLAGVHIPNFPLGVIVLAMNSCAYQCEIMRAGIQSIPKGQFEAARSLGMNGAQTLFHVILPQTVRRIIPTMTNEFILLYKDTSMLAAVGVMEIVMYAKTIVANTGSITPYIVAACFYLLVTIPMARFVGGLERKLANNDSGSTSRKHGKKNKQLTAEEQQKMAQRTLDEITQTTSSGTATSSMAPSTREDL